MGQTLTDPVLKRADELAIGDRIQPGFLPAYARSGEGTVRYLETYHYQGADWVFAAFACADGDRNCAYYLPGGMLKVVPADTGLGYSRADDGEVTQPIAGRVPAHYGAVEVAGGLVEIKGGAEPVHYRFGMHDTACGLKPGNVPAATSEYAKVTCHACIDRLPS